MATTSGTVKPKPTRASKAVQTDSAAQHPTSPSLAAVPDMKYFDSYVQRTLPGGKKDFDVFDFSREFKHNVLIEGPTGPGKTSACLAYAAKRLRPFYAIPSNVGIEPSQLFGKYIPDGNGGFKWVDGPVTTLVRTGGVLLINEVNFMPERVATVLFGLLDKRRQIILLDHEAEVITAHDDLLIIADMNPDYEGTRPLNKAFRNRFSIQVWWDYDPKVEKRLVQSQGLLDMASQIRAETRKGTFETPLSTNMLIEFESILQGMGIDFAIANFVNHYATEEREAIEQILVTVKGNIEQDFAEPEPSDDDEDEGDWEYEDDMTPEELALYQKRRAMKNGERDEEWGIKGIDWYYQDSEEDDSDA